MTIHIIYNILYNLVLEIRIKAMITLCMVVSNTVQHLLRVAEGFTGVAGSAQGPTQGFGRRGGRAVRVVEAPRPTRVLNTRGKVSLNNNNNTY